MADINSPEKDFFTTSHEDKILQSSDTKNNKNKPSTSAEETHISHNDSLAPSSDQIEKFEIGDIVWAKIGKYPFWPSIVCIDPDTKTHMRGSLDEKKKFSLHVRFCNDNGRRSWAKTLESYSGKANLLTKYPNCLGLMKSSKKQMEMWSLAVEEADKWLKFDRKERWVEFSNLNKIISPCKSPTQSSSASVSNNNGTASKKKITEGSNHNASNSFKMYSKKMSVGEVPEEDFKKNMAVKKKIKEKEDKKITPLIDISFSTLVPEINYHINDVENIPGTTRRKVDEKIRRDIMELEAEGIRKIKEWKALQLAKTAKFDL